MNILLVDDDPDILRIVATMLAEQGHWVQTAADGRAAVEALAGKRFSMVVTDWMMPDLDGLDLVRRLRASEGLSYAYVLMLTVRSDPASINEALAAGVDDLLVKPVRREDLLARLRVAERIITLQGELLRRNAALTQVNKRLRRDLDAAAQVQRALLPAVAPAVPGWDVAWRVSPCDELAGDTLNCFQLDERHLAAYVLDVSGHGVSSALLAVQASRLLQPVMGLGSMLKEPQAAPPRYRLVPPVEVMRNLGEKFPPQWEAPQFFTILYAQIEISSGRCLFAGGGHPGPIILGPDGAAKVLDLPSSAIGMLPAAQCEFAQGEVVIQPGGRLLLYSDGVTETREASGGIYGSERLIGTFARFREAPLTGALEGILADIADFRGGAPTADDVTLLALEHRE